MKRTTRVRFAPSPTGPLHMGGVRTALYNYLYAKQRGGKFILRIEDTDSQRFVPGSEEYIIESLAWCGITPDEGVENGTIVSESSLNHPYAPYRQSERKELYRKYAQQLVDDGFAYYAFDTALQLEELRAKAELQGSIFTYNYEVRESLNNSLNINKEECEELLQNRNDWVIRFKMPKERVIKMKDIIRGEIEVNSSTLDDKVLWKSIDGLPTYHLANVVDDKLMKITDVIRGEEWLPSLPLHYMLYESLGWGDIRPNFAHLPLLLNPNGKGKLSKRDGDRLGFPVFPLEWRGGDGEISKGYREEGYFPQAFVNMLAFLGWNPGTEQEIFSLEELVDSFSLERVVRSGAKFNLEKAKWYNQEYLRAMSSEQLATLFMPTLIQKEIDVPLSYVAEVMDLIKERISFISEAWSLSSYFFIAPTEYDQKVKEKFWKGEIPQAVKGITKMLSKCRPFTKEQIETILPDYIKERELPMGAIMNSLRLLLVGESKGPGVAEIMALIGKEESVSRLNREL